jgi:hypothetical protein
MQVKPIITIFHMWKVKIVFLPNFKPNFQWLLGDMREMVVDCAELTLIGADWFM